MSELKTNLEQILQEKNEKIISQNIKKNVEVLGVTGSYDKEDIHELEAELADAQNELATVRRDLDNSTATISGSGENVTLNGTAEARFKTPPLPMGNSEQVQYSGKQLFDIDNLEYKENISTATGTISNNKIRVTLSTDGQFKYAVYFINNPEKWLGKSLSISCKAVTSSSNNGRILLRYHNPGNVFGDIANLPANGGSFTVADSLPTGATTIGIYFYANQNSDTHAQGDYVEYSEILVKETSITDTTYEPYVGGQASPNPDYPQEITNVTGDVEVKVQSKNLAKEVFDQKLSIDGTGQNRTVTSTNKYRAQIIEVKPNTNYVISGDFSALDDRYMRIGMFDNYPIIGSITTKYVYGASPLTFTTDTNTKYILLYNSAVIDTVVINLQLEESSTSTDYVPHQEQLLPLALKSKNLFNGVQYAGAKRTYNGVTAKVNDDGSIIFSGTATGSYAGGLSITLGSMPELNGKQLKVSITSSNPNIFCFLQNPSGYLSSITYDSSKNLILLIQLGTNLVTVNETFNVQIEEGSTATDYEPYYNYELCKIGDYRDYFWKDETANKWYLHKEINKHVFTGTETWYKANDNINVYVTNLSQLDKLSGDNSNFICNYFKYLGDAQTQILGNCMSFNSGEAYRNSCYIQCDISIAQSNVELKNYVKALYDNQTPILVYSVLKTPTDIEITDTTLISQLEAIRKAISYNEQTNVSSNTIALFDIIALRNMNTILNTLENEIELLP